MSEYREVAESWVDATTRTLVDVVVSLTSGDLDIRRPRVCYFDHRYAAGAGHKFAFHWPAEWLGGARERLVGKVSAGGGTIYVEADLNQGDAMTTAVHEVRHAYQTHQPRLFAGWDHDDLEVDAERFALGWMRKFNRSTR